MTSKLKSDVEILAAPGTRKIGTAGHTQAREYLVQRMSEIGLDHYSGRSYELPYTVEGYAYTNLAGVFRGSNAALEPILLIAHYDTCGDQPGADDNAAAIAVWLDVLRTLNASQSLSRDLIVLFPDAEEPPNFLTQHMGSSNFYKHQRKGPIHCGLVLDLVGHDVPVEGMEDLIFMFGAESHPGWTDVILETELPNDLRNIATLNRYVGDLSDHHILRENAEPYLFFTCGRWEHYHQVSDLPRYLNYDKMEALVRYLRRMLQKLDSIPFEATQGDYDPILMELKLMKRAIGPFLERQNIPMSKRDDVQKFVLGWIKSHQL